MIPLSVQIRVSRADLPRLLEQIESAIKRGTVDAAEELAEILSQFIDPSWQQYAPKTIYNRSLAGLGPIPDLKFSGKMKNSLVVTRKENGAVILADPLAFYHERGTSKMPVRKWLTNPILEHATVVAEAIKRSLEGVSV